MKRDSFPQSWEKVQVPAPSPSESISSGPHILLRKLLPGKSAFPGTPRMKGFLRRLISRMLVGIGSVVVLGALATIAFGAGHPQEKKPTAKDSPQSTLPGHADFIKSTSSPAPSKDSKTSPTESSSSEHRHRPPSRHYYYYYWPWPYPPPPPPYPYPYYYGPIFVDPDTAGYGPRSVMRLMGVEHWFSARPSPPKQESGGNTLGNRAGRPEAAPFAGPQAAAQAPNAPDPNPPLILQGPQQEKGPQQEAGKALPQGEKPAGEPGPDPQRAMLLVDFGDAHFANKKYADALQRYREAARLDADLSEAHLHMGFALIALGKYDEAAQAFKRGLELNPNWPASGFRLRQLYGPQEAERLAHRNALAAAAAQEQNADPLFLLGVLFYFDDMRDQARRCFVEAARLAGGQAAHIDLFLRRL